MVKGVKAVIFDMGGVAVSDIDNKVYSSAAKYYGVSIRKIKRVLEIHEKGRHKAGWRESEYWKIVARDLGSNKPSRHFWTESYENIAAPNKQIFKIIEHLKAKNYKIAVLSNTCDSHIHINNKKGIYNLFDVKIFSCEPAVNAEKPGIKIYKICIKRIGLSPRECIFIDDKKKYLIPARKLGMKTILYKNPRQLKTQLKRFGVDA